MSKERTYLHVNNWINCKLCGKQLKWLPCKMLPDKQLASNEAHILIIVCKSLNDTLMSLPYIVLFTKWKLAKSEVVLPHSNDVFKLNFNWKRIFHVPNAGFGNYNSGVAQYTNSQANSSDKNHAKNINQVKKTFIQNTTINIQHLYLKLRIQLMISHQA